MAGVILAGGRSRRFGSNKALALYRGRPLIAHVAWTMTGLFSEKLLVTNQPEQYAFLGWPMTGDLIREAGPLAGIQAALRRIEHKRAFVVACDMPVIDPAVILRLCRYPGDWDVVLPNWEPLHAVYHRRILAAVDAALARGEGKISCLLASLRVRALNAAELGLTARAGNITGSPAGNNTGNTEGNIEGGAKGGTAGSITVNVRKNVFANINFTRDLTNLP